MFKCKFLFVLILFFGLFLFLSIKPTFQNSKNTEERNNTVTEKLTQHMNKEGITWYVFLLAFISGILVSFTPCIYPMIPITMGILQKHAQNSILHNVIAASLYVFGMSLIYAMLGYLSVVTGNIFGYWLSNPIFIVIIVLFFLYLSLSMFGFYTIKLPFSLLQNKQIDPKGSLFKVFLFGMISGTITSPCLTPPLAALLAIVSKIGNPIAGFFILLSFALGMGTLLIIIGTFSGGLSLLPRGGQWLIEIKKIIGFAMLFVCVFLLEPLIGDFLTKIGCVIIIFLGVIYYFIRFIKNEKQQT